MNKMNMVFPIIGALLASSLAGGLVFEQFEITNLRNGYDEQIRNLNNTYNERITNLNNTYNMLNTSYYQTLSTLQQVTDSLNFSAPTVQFDKNIYYPYAQVFWKPNVSVPIGVKVVDRNVDLNFVKAKVSSSVDSKEITLAKVNSGVFMGTVFAHGLGLGESISNTSSFNVRYGDVIVAQYFDRFKGSIAVAGALFGFPMYVSDSESVSLDSWKLFDSEGVPLVDIGSHIRIQYNPVTVCCYALANYHMYVTTENSTFREAFLLQAKWLVKNAEQKGNFSVWEYKFDEPDYYLHFNLTNPWVSAMAQGLGLSVFSRAYALTGNTTYLDTAETAMRSFDIEMNSGGVRYTDSDGVWFEEYADEGALSGKVLNGFIFALLGLYGYSFLTNSGEAYAMFWEGALTLSANIHRYDSGSWSYYDLLYHYIIPLDYHKGHINQLRIMYELTNIENFLFYSNKFQSYID